MRIRIQLGQGPQVQNRGGKNRHLAAGAAGLLTPAALVVGALGIWNLCSEFGIAGEFAIREGVFSYWQVWVILAGVIEGISILLHRYGLKREPGDSSVARRNSI
jgi:hypothetical protein